jgi:proteasome accessory factor C
VTGDLSSLRKVLAILPVVQANQGIRVGELARITGIPEQEIVSDLPDLVNLVGIPPYSPGDLVDFEIEGDRVRIRFAEQFRRPVCLTLREALALDMALAGLEEEAEGPFARAVAGIRAKVRAALAPEVAAELSRAAPGILGVAGPGRAGDRVARVKAALERQLELRIEYFSHSSGRLAERLLRPYGIYEQGGHYYVVGWSEPPGRILTLRADRIRSVCRNGKEYEVPEDFEVGAYRRESVPESGAERVGHAVTVRFEPDRARFARELFPASRLEAEPDGSLRAELRTRGTFWLVSELLRWGSSAYVEAPRSVRRELLRAARRTRELYGRQ